MREAGLTGQSGQLVLVGMDYCICYHGTNAKSAISIAKTGFRPWSHFARKIEDAVAFGGKYVFSVRFDQSKMPEDDENDQDNWQFHNIHTIPPSEIILLEIA